MKRRGFLEWSKVLAWLDDQLDVGDVKETLRRHVFDEEGRIWDVTTGEEVTMESEVLRRQLDKRRLDLLRREVKRRLEKKETKVVMKVGDIEILETETVEIVRLDDPVDDVVRAVKRARNLWRWLLGRQKMREDWDVLRDGFELVEERAQWVEKREGSVVRRLRKYMVTTKDGKTKLVVRNRFELGLVKKLLRVLVSLQREKKRLKEMEERLRRAWREKKKELEKKTEEDEIVIIEE